MNFHSNLLTGPVPSSFARLQNLEQLWLSYNSLSGPIPPELGGPEPALPLDPSAPPGLASLKMLDLRENDLTGSIPAELARLQRLEDLWLGLNGLTGEVPPELGGASALGYVYLSGNGFTGCIPNEIEHVAVNDFGLLGMLFCDGTSP